MCLMKHSGAGVIKWVKCMWHSIKIVVAKKKSIKRDFISFSITAKTQPLSDGSANQQQTKTKRDVQHKVKSTKNISRMKRLSKRSGTPACHTELERYCRLVFIKSNRESTFPFKI